MDEKEIKQECLKLVESIDSMYLGTNGKDGRPQIRMMSNLRCPQICAKAPKELFADHKDDFTAYMVTGDSSDKMKEIRANPNVSVYYCKAEEFHTLLLTGTAEDVQDIELKKRIWQEDWKIHWPGGPEDPELVLLKMTPQHAKGWYKEGLFKFSL